MIYSAPTPITAHQGVTGRTHGVAVETTEKTPHTDYEVVILRDYSTHEIVDYYCEMRPPYSCLPYHYYYYSYAPQPQHTQPMSAPTTYITTERLLEPLQDAVVD